MKQETSQWGKAVKKAVIDHDMTLKQLAEKIGYSNATVSQVVNGRYSNSSYKVIAEKINEVLGTEGLPERTETPSDEWCQTVKVELVKQSIPYLTKVVKENNSGDDTEDLFFLLSADEVDPKKTPYKYYEDVTNRQKKNADGETDYHRLRSALRGDSCNTWYVYSSGSVSGDTAIYAYRCAPACTIA